MDDRETCYRFADFELDPRERTLARGGQPVTLQPKVFDALLLFCQRPGELLSRQTLLEQLWPDCVVGDESLTQIIHKLRRALDDTSAAPRFVQTLPRRGVRFVAAVETFSLELRAARSRAADTTLMPAPPSSSPSMALQSPPPPAPPPIEHEAPPPRETAVPARRWAMTLAAATLGIAALVFGLRSRPRTVEAALEPGAATIRRLTHFIERDEDGTFSPDGHTVAFVSKHEGQGLFKLYTMSTDGGTPVRLTRSAADETTPRFSPDGRSLSYVRHDPGASHGDIWRIAPLGGQEALLAADGTLADWLPDGKSLVVVRPTGQGESHLVRVELDGGAEQVILRWPGWIDGMAIAPTGDQLAFVSEQSIFQMSWQLPSKMPLELPSKGGPPIRVVTGGTHVESVSFSPSGHHLLFDSNRGGRGNLWQLPLDGGEPRSLTVGAGHDLYPSKSRSGALLYTSEVVHRIPYLVDADGANPRRLPVKTSYLSLAVSPGGSEIAVADYDDGAMATGECTLSVLSLPTLASRALGPGRDPAFSPDGARLAALSEGALWEIDLASGRRRRIAQVVGNGAAPAWSPDGHQLALASARETGLVIIDADRGISRTLSTGRFAGVSWSPDGRFLAACGTGPQGAGLYRFPLAAPESGGRISELCSYEAAPLWDADGGLRVLLHERTRPELVALDEAGREMGSILLRHDDDPRFWGIFEAHKLATGWLYLLQLVEGDLYLMEPRPALSGSSK